MVLQRLFENQLRIKAEKCKFHVPSVLFLGFIFKAGQYRTDPIKTKAVEEWPIPKNRKQLQWFLGFVNFYRRFIRDYSRVAAPLTQLTSSPRIFQWSPEADKAFCILKQLFSSTHILCHSYPQRQFILEVDTSDTGVGAVRRR